MATYTNHAQRELDAELFAEDDKRRAAHERVVCVPEGAFAVRLTNVTVPRDTDRDEDISVRLCSIDGCQKIHFSKGWCRLHYSRWLRHGDPMVCLRQRRGPTCSFEGCDRRPHANGLCNPHYLQAQRGSTLHPLFGHLVAEKKEAFITRAATYEGNDCLIWPFFRNSKGYALHEGRREAHRIVCERVHGAPPSPKHQAAHSCGKGCSACVSGRHLSWKTRKENERDKIRHGTAPRGERQGRHKLKEADVIKIRELLKSHTKTDIAAMYGVHRLTISMIARGRNWAWLPPVKTDLDDQITEAIYDAVCDGEGRATPYYLRHHLAQRGLLIVEADKHSAALLRSQLVASTVATIKANGA